MDSQLWTSILQIQGYPLIRETLLTLKAHIASHKITVGRLQYPTLSNGQIAETKLNRDTVPLIEFKNQMDVSDIYWTFHPKTK